MFVTGGLATLGLGTTESLNDRCNNTYPPIRVLDTSAYTWRTQFDPDLKYSVPEEVTAVIGKSSTGGAVLSSPASGWTTDELSTIFSKRTPRATYSFTTSSNTTTALAGTNTEDSASSQGGTNNLSGGAIAGIVISVVAILIILGVALLWRMKRNQKLQMGLKDTKEPDDGHGWQKPELEANEQGWHELGMRTEIHEAHGHGVVASRAELPAQSKPSELP